MVSFMNFLNPRKQAQESRKTYLSLIWTPILLLVAVILGVVFLFVFNDKIGTAPLDDFDTMQVSDGFHTITLPDGKSFTLAYEQNHDTTFTGLIRHINMDHELIFPIISFDILVTTGDFSNSSLISANVEDHHFYWQSNMTSTPSGTIHLLHTVPMNQEVENKLMNLKEGDQVKVIGWEIFDIKAYSNTGNYLGYWKDSGCNSLLVTEVSNPQ